MQNKWSFVFLSGDTYSDFCKKWVSSTHVVRKVRRKRDDTRVERKPVAFPQVRYDYGSDQKDSNGGS